MSQKQLTGPLIQYPQLHTYGNAAGVTATVDATGERLHMVGQLYLDGGSGSKTLDTNGFIGFRTAALTWANASTNLTVGVQDVSAATAPAQGDATFDVSAVYVPGTDTLTATAWNKIQMDNGSKTLTHGQLIAIVIEMTVRGGTDSVTCVLSGHVPNSNLAGPCQSTCVLETSGPTFATQAAVPGAIIEFGDGTLGWLAWSSITSANNSNIQYASNTGTADEYGNLIVAPVTCVAAGVLASVNLDGTSADFEVCFYSDPLGTPVLIEAVTVDATQCGTTGAQRSLPVLFSTRRQITAGSTYAVTIRPTTTNTLRSYYFDVSEATHWKAWGTPSDCYAVRRLDNTGAFSDYNGGTAKTRRMNTALLIDAFDDGTGMGNANLHIGI